MDLTSFDLPTFLRGATQEVFDTMLSMELAEKDKAELESSGPHFF